MYDFEYEPFLYVETNSAQYDAKSLFNTNLKKIVFKNESARNQYVKDAGIRRVFYNLRAEQQFLLDLYRDKEFDWSHLPFKTFYLDIEVYTAKYKNDKKVKIRKKIDTQKTRGSNI